MKFPSTETKEIAPNETKTETTDATSTPAAAATTINTATKTETYFEEAEVADLAEQQRYNLKHREVFYSKYTDTIAATSIRAKCSVLLFCEEIEKYSEYLSREVRHKFKFLKITRTSENSSRLPHHIHNKKKATNLGN